MANQPSNGNVRQAGWVLSIVAYLLLLLLGFLNPWLLVALALGVLLGLIARFGIGAARHRRRDSPPQGRQVTRRTILLGGAVLLVTMGVAYFVLGYGAENALACSESRFSALYEGTARGNPATETWTIDDQLTIPATVLTGLAEAPPPLGPSTEIAARVQVNGELQALGWSLAGSTDGQARFVRTRTEPISVPRWPLLTTIELEVPSPSWGSCFSGVRLTPGEGSRLTLTAPAHFIVHTFPVGEEEDMLNGERSWPVSVTSGATYSNVVRVQIASPLVRNDITSKAAELSLSGAVLWLVGILGAIFNDQVKDILGRPIKRLLEFLHLRKPESKKETPAT